MNVKLLLKRYFLPLILVVIIYSLVFFIFGKDQYFNIGLIMSILFFYLVRLVDDFFDYDKDLGDNKVLFSKKILNILICLLGLIYIFCSIFFGYYYFLFLLILILLSIIFRYAKVLFIPSVIWLIIFYEMSFNYAYFIISLSFIIIDLYLIRKE